MYFAVILLSFVIIQLNNLDYVNGERVIEIESFEGSPDKTWIDWNTLRLTKKARNEFVVSGDFTIHRNLGEQQRIDIKVFRIDNKGKAMPNAIYSENHDMCTYRKNDRMVYPSLVEHSNLPAPDICPLPKGEYSIKNFEFNVEKVPSFIGAGKYKAIVKWIDDGKDVASIEMEIAISHEKN